VAVHFSGSLQGAQDAAACITSAGGGAFLLQADLSAADAPARLVADLIQELEARQLPPAFDILINNAGVSVDKTIQDTSEEEFERTFAVNVRAPFFVIKAALPLLRHGGRIVNLSSGLSQIAFPDDIAYGMSKQAINALTRSLAKQLGHRDITVNAIGPGIIATDFNAGLLSNEKGRQIAAGIAALGRIGQVSDVADVVAFLVSNDARWITGAYIDASGGSLLG
jgi:NAD(P)-dependent dehydrogenase (short-subunit alcohol dehydrogenase family)